MVWEKLGRWKWIRTPAQTRTPKGSSASVLSSFCTTTACGLISLTIVLVKMSILFSLNVDSVYEISCGAERQFVYKRGELQFADLFGEHGEHGG